MGGVRVRERGAENEQGPGVGGGSFGAHSRNLCVALRTGDTPGVVEWRPIPVMSVRHHTCAIPWIKDERHDAQARGQATTGEAGVASLCCRMSLRPGMRRARARLGHAEGTVDLDQLPHAAHGLSTDGRRASAGAIGRCQRR